MSQTQNHDIDWNHARVPSGASFIHFECPQCGHEVTASPRAKTVWMPKLYCTECEHGPPYRKVRIEFADEVVERP